ncbi:MAG: aminoacyl-tRNA hydrolase [Opitutaceae bacterium]|jgi:PTH1 family peptidyl-tRNA hydrolase|nr:aminoacyl-tRNA hydrolase [Opitutaceae bacterium]
MSISLVAGLGNPGRAYAATRHNAGWMVLDALAADEKLSWQPQDRFEAETARWDFAPGHTVWLAKPLTFMNLSGRAIQKLAAFHKVPPADITVIYDDLTIELGLMKVAVRGSAGGHNGVADLLQRMGDGFVRYRLGIGPKAPPEMDIKDYVLGRFTDDQQLLFNQNIPRFVSGLRLLLAQGPDKAMNQLNRRTLTP